MRLGVFAPSVILNTWEEVSPSQRLITPCSTENYCVNSVIWILTKGFLVLTAGSVMVSRPGKWWDSDIPGMKKENVTDATGHHNHTLMSVSGQRFLKGIHSPRVKKSSIFR